MYIYVCVCVCVSQYSIIEGSDKIVELKEYANLRRMSNMCRDKEGI